MSMNYLRLCILACSFMIGTISQAQVRSKVYEQYIDKYKHIAIEEMNKHHIPASITLAQGILESGAGQSWLAKASNNHFGIKCGISWTGNTIRHDDDARAECFRAYKHAKESYEDHSKFLRTGQRYAFLFKLNPTDYKGWARGLKKAGYATAPDYATKLINLIELYGLYNYDQKSNRKWVVNNSDAHQPYLANGLLYVVARAGDTWKSISKEFDISSRKLIKYNDLYKEYILKEGDIVYLEKKRVRADEEHIIHQVRPGDSMYSISQRYGIQLKKLYKMNKMRPEDPAPYVGYYIRLR